MFGAMNVVVVVVVQHLVCCVKILFWRRCHPPLLALKIIRACRGKQRRGRLSLLLRSPTRLPWIYSLLLPLLRRRPLKWEHTKNHADLCYFIVLVYEPCSSCPQLPRFVSTGTGTRGFWFWRSDQHPRNYAQSPTCMHSDSSFFIYIYIYIIL